MPYENEDDGLALDLTPLVTGINAGTDAYAKIKAADAAKAAAVAAAKAQAAQRQVAPSRGRSPLSYLLLAAAVGGIGYLGLRATGILGKRRRR